MGRERLLDIRDFFVVGYYRLRAARGAGRAAMAGVVLLGSLGAGLFVARHHLFPHAKPEMAAASPAISPAPVAKVAAAPAVTPAPQPMAVADAPAAPAKIDMRVIGSIAPVDDPIKKKKKKKAKEHKASTEAKALSDKKKASDKKDPLDAAQ